MAGEDGFWLPLPGTPGASLAAQSAGLGAVYTLTTTETTIPSWSVTVTDAGTYLLMLTLDGDVAGADTFAYGRFAVNGVVVAPTCWLKRGGTQGASGNSAIQRSSALAAGDVITVKAAKSGGGSSSIWNGNSMITVVGPL